MPSKVQEETFNPLVLKRDDKGAFKGDPKQPFANTNFKKNKGDFHWIYSDEPHTTRRREILKAHPEIKNLFGPEPLTGVIVVAIVLSQIWISSWIGNASWLTFLLVGYIYGGTVNHSLQLANHEISHNLAFESINANIVLGMVANLCTGVPSSVTFRYYHMDHHQFQGVDIIDTDIPTEWELRTFTTTPLKLIWMLGQVFAYAFRPMMTSPKPITTQQIMNVSIQLIFDYLIYKYFGIWALIYMLYGSLIGLGLHPAAGHFIAEHYEFVQGYETYSYYGSCNYLNFNVGMHNEHHDFPKIPWSRLGMVRKIAPEWYEHLPQHNSYIAVIYKYITDPAMGPWSRVKRKTCSKLEKSLKNKKKK